MTILFYMKPIYRNTGGAPRGITIGSKKPGSKKEIEDFIKEEMKRVKRQKEEEAFLFVISLLVVFAL